MTTVTPAELKKWMKIHNKLPVDVSSLTHVSLRTVERFLSGQTQGSPLVLDALAKLVREAKTENTVL